MRTLMCFLVKEVNRMNIGFIGSGHMVSAIIKGMTHSTSTFDKKTLYVMSKSGITAKKLAMACDISYCEDVVTLIKTCEVIILGVKPHVLDTLLPELSPLLHQKKRIVVSLAAGKSLDDLQNLLSNELEIVRVMPNLNANVLASTTGLCANLKTTKATKVLVKQVCETFGEVVEVEESQFSIFTALAGSSVAFVYLYMDALARAAVKAGMPKHQALDIITKTVSGSAHMVDQSEVVPWALIDQVCSPGGVTIEGIATLQAGGFETILTQAFDAMIEKDQMMGKK